MWTVGRVILATLPLLALTLVPSLAVQGPQRVPADSMRLTVNQVVIDVVVVDKKGQQSRELQPEDFEVYEDGVIQKLHSVRYVGSSSAESPPPVRGKESAHPVETASRARPETQQINLVTLVFDRLSVYGRNAARQAGEKYLDQLGPNDFLSVMVVDRRLQVLSQFTGDRGRLMQAIELATTGTSEQFADVSREVEEATSRADLIQAQGEATPQADAQNPAGASNVPYSEAMANRAIARLLTSAGRAENYIQGAATVDALKQVVNSQRQLPGRKAIVFFAEDLRLPLGVVERFRDLISAANRAQISFYSVDTTGLQQAGQLDRTRQELNRLMNVGKRQMQKRSGAVQQDEVYLNENVNEAIRLSSQENLAALAVSTGGVLVANTNDLGTEMKTITEDFRSHYELSYTPSNRIYDGSFRKIEIKIKRPGLSARSREGYFALPDNGLAESPFELPLLDALAKVTPPRDFPFRSGAFIFPTQTGKSEVVLYIESPLAGFRFSLDAKANRYSARIAVMVGVKDHSGRNVEKFSQEFPFEGEAAKAEETRSRTFVFSRTAILPPGRYTVEAAVHDPQGEKSSVKRTVLVVPSRTADLSLSSLVVVRRLDEASVEAGLVENPLQFGRQFVVPALNTSFNLREWSELGFYFVASCSGNQEATTDLIVTKEGVGVGHMGERPLPAPDPKGQIKYLTGLPVESMQPGNYEIEVIVRQGQRVARSKGRFSLQ